MEAVEGAAAVVAVHKTSRAHVFRAFLLSTFGPSTLQRGVLDVAGGRGELAVPLVCAGYPTTVVDPRPVDLQRNKVIKNLAYHLSKKDTKTYDRLPDSVKAKGSIPLPLMLPEWFTASGNVEELELMRSAGEGGSKQQRQQQGGTSTSSGAIDSSRYAESEDLTAVKRGCGIIVGMHPDQATDAIVAYAVANEKPFAVVPCCVFPKQFPKRRFLSNSNIRSTSEGSCDEEAQQLKPVRTYDDYIQYLLQFNKGLQCTALPFAGRNVVVWGVPPYSSA